MATVGKRITERPSTEADDAFLVEGSRSGWILKEELT